MKNEKMDYIKNNDKIILMYENLYKKGVDIDKLKILFKKKLFLNKYNHKVEDFIKFRLFLDSCLVLFNKEKVEKKYFKDSFIYALYFNKENMPKMFANIENEKIIELISKKIYNKNENKPQVVYNSSNDKIYDQLKDLRNAFAHMSYGSFFFIKIIFSLIKYIIKIVI